MRPPELAHALLIGDFEYPLPVTSSSFSESATDHRVAAIGAPRPRYPGASDSTRKPPLSGIDEVPPGAAPGEKK
jgi:hypothetical protein